MYAEKYQNIIEKIYITYPKQNVKKKIIKLHVFLILLYTNCRIHKNKNRVEEHFSL